MTATEAGRGPVRVLGLEVRPAGDDGRELFVRGEAPMPRACPVYDIVRAFAAAGDAAPDETAVPDGISVRWGLAGDEGAVADLLDLNGMPRWVAFEEHFVVAEERGRVAAAVRYRTGPKRLSRRR